MFQILKHWRLLLALSTLGAGPAGAQAPASGTSPTRAADPTQAQAVVPAALYRSAFDGYRRHGETVPGPWKDANDTVTRIGGWRSYAREAAAAAASAPAARSAP